VETGVQPFLDYPKNSVSDFRVNPLFAVFWWFAPGFVSTKNRGKGRKIRWGLICRPGIFLYNAEVDFFPVDHDLGRSFDPDFHLAALDFKNPDLYAIANGNGFPWFSGKYEHGVRPPWLD